jgi:enterochelin esterase family protein
MTITALRFASCAWLALVALLGAQPSGPIQQTGVSPRIQQLKDQISRGRAAARDEFWTALERDHTPLVEAIPGDPGHVLVTFVWRGAPGTRSIGVAGMEMTLIPGTDVWYVTITMVKDQRLSYGFKPMTGPADAPSPAQPDPLNPHRFIPPVASERPASAVNPDSPYMNSSIAVLPDAPAAPWVDPRPGVPAGRVEERAYESQIYKGPRRVWMYTPPGGRPEGLLICLWGLDYLNEIPVPTILDNLTHAARIPRLAAIFVDNTGDRFQNFQSTERFTRSLGGELLPWARAALGVSADARHTIVAGYSASGLASVYAAFAHPDLFGNVLAQSGAFWRGFEGDGASDSEWLANQYAAAPARDTRFYLDVGGREDVRPGGGPVVFKEANRRLRDVLIRKGYAVVYEEVPGGQHEFIHWRGTFGNGLIALTKAWADR